MGSSLERAYLHNELWTGGSGIVSGICDAPRDTIRAHSELLGSPWPFISCLEQPPCINKPGTQPSPAKSLPFLVLVELETSELESPLPLGERLSI